MLQYFIFAAAVIILIIDIIRLIAVKTGQKKQGEIPPEIKNDFCNIQQRLSDSSRAVADEFQRNRRETAESLKEMNTLIREIQSINSRYNEKINVTLTDSVKQLQESNEKKLEQMRQTVDEKLSSTLSQRLDSSFKLVGEQLKDVHKSLGEMRELAGGVSDLQRVLTNVKARGTWAEVQLGNILEQILTPSQYETNVAVKGNGEMVEYAVKIPSREDDGRTVWLPIDSKFPQEDYIRLCDASERADKAAVDEAVKALERTVKNSAATISKLYIDVPNTTNFAIMFLATEGLFAEIIRRPGLVEEIQNKYRVMVCGPTTITAFLNTLSMGFRTIAIDRKAADVWKVLGAAKTQYENFETILTKAKKKIEEAGSTLDEAQRRNNIIRKNLKGVEQLELSESEKVLSLEETVLDNEA